MPSAETSPPATEPVEKMKPGELNVDLKNPRMPGTRFADEAAALAHLAKYGALDELTSSIASSGWLDFEPLIVLAHDDDLGIDNVVIEGNRRLAALRFLKDPDLARSLKVPVPSDGPHFVPEEVRVWMVDSRSKARSFIGFKHINGAYRWNSYAKAKFAADWLRDEPDIGAVAEQLGDSHSTVLRLVNGYKVLAQADLAGVAPEIGEKFAFSHLYTGLTRPGIRNFVGDRHCGLCMQPRKRGLQDQDR